MLKRCLIVALIFLTQAVAAQDGVVVLSDTVTGNQEQPKVLYIVPWQAADDHTILYQPLTSRLQNDVFKHIERTEQVRELKYLETLAQTPSKSAE